MTKATIAGGAAATVLVLLALAVCYRALEQDVDPAAATSPATTASTGAAVAEAHPSFLYGRVTTHGGATYEGRLRWGGDEEAFWGDYFNGSKDENPWVAHVPLERLPKERRPIEIFGSRSPTGSARSTSAGLSWRASATSRASRRAAATCG